MINTESKHVDLVDEYLIDLFGPKHKDAIISSIRTDFDCDGYEEELLTVNYYDENQVVLQEWF